MLRPIPILALILILALSLAATAHAQSFGRVIIVAQDADGNPVAGVKVTVTCEELPKFMDEQTTDRRGRATFGVADATKAYVFHFEADGYPPFDATIKPVVRDTITREVTLSSDYGGTAAGAEEGLVFTPAEEAFNRGVEALRAGDVATAKSEFLEALNRDRKFAAAHSALAGIYLEEGDHAAALEAARTLVELEPENPRAYRLLYQAHQGLGNKEEADAALEALTKLDQGGDTAAMIYNEGVAAVKVGDYRSAGERFAEALRLQPELKSALAGLALVQLTNKQFQEAAATAEKLLALEPQHKNGLRIRYEAYKELGDEAKKAEAFAALAAVDPATLAQDLYEKAIEQFNDGDTPGATSNLEQALELDPERVKAHYYLGLCYVNSGETAQAKEHFEKFIALAPDDPDAATAKEMLGYLQ